MGDKVIMLEIFQPFAQYRYPFTFYYAQTYPLPPKSTIIGMLQNATGNYYNEKFWNLKVSIHGGFESVFWNYQNLIKATKTGIQIVKYKEQLALYNQGLPLYGQGLTSQRSPVNQQELFNGHLFIFIRGEAELIAEIESVLRRPSKILYLGRSEDVIFVKKIWIMEELEVFRKQTRSRFFTVQFPTYIRREIKTEDGEKSFPIKKEKFPVYSIGTFVQFKNNGKPIKNRAEITRDKTERKAEFETVIYIGNDSPVLLSENINLEIYKLNCSEKVFKIPEEFGWI